MAEIRDVALPNTSEVYRPSDAIVENSNVMAYARSRGFSSYEELYQWTLDNNEQFWADMASELEWFQPWEKVLDDSNKPFFKWFTGAKTNIVHNAIDRHAASWRKNKLAMVWEGEDGTQRTFSYHALNREVSKMANVLKSVGVKKGDIVTIYLPRIPELPMMMLACAKIGAAHSVVYGGFSEAALADRLADAQSKVLVTADGGFMRGKIVELKKIADEAMARTPTVQTCLVIKRTGHSINMELGRDLWLHELMGLPIAAADCPTEVMDAEDPLFILYTSGTTGKPKGVVHTHGGYMVGIYATLKMVFDIKEDDRYWCAADPGWITGHSYIVYAPLITGATSFMYEGAPNYPFPDRWWSLVSKHSISILYTAPTAIRGLMRFGEAWPSRHDLSSLRLLGSVGEPINPAAWEWYYRVIGKERCPIVDTWWQTETGSILIAPLPGATPLKPGSATFPLPGVVPEVVDFSGRPVEAGKEGYLVIRRPWPSMMRTIWGDPKRYEEQYWSRVPGSYFTGDAARRDADGYFWILGRVDDVMNVSGHRLSTMEIESALVKHPAVAEAAVVGRPDEITGQAVCAFVTLKQGAWNHEELAVELRDYVAREIGKFARPAEIRFTEALPKTRSGKIMRRLLREIVTTHTVTGDITTLEDFTVVSRLAAEED